MGCCRCLCNLSSHARYELTLAILCGSVAVWRTINEYSIWYGIFGYLAVIVFIIYIKKFVHLRVLKEVILTFRCIVLIISLLTITLSDVLTAVYCKNTSETSPGLSSGMYTLYLILNTGLYIALCCFSILEPSKNLKIVFTSIVDRK